MVTDQVATAPRSVFVDPRCQSFCLRFMSSAGSELQRQTNTEPRSGSDRVVPETLTIVGPQIRNQEQ